MKEYLGDGAYVKFDGYGLELTTEDGMRATNTIYLEPEVWRALEAFVKGLKSPSRDPNGVTSDGEEKDQQPGEE